MDLPNFGGRFFQCRLRSAPSAPLTSSDQPTKDAAFLHWVDQQLDNDSPASTFPEELSYHFFRAQPPPTAPVSGLSGATSPPEATYVYLDVGAWIGSRDAKWGRRAGVPRPGLKRDFGIVCGPHVLLGTFGYAWPDGAPTEDTAWTALRGQSGKAASSLNAMVRALSGTANGLGSALITRYVPARATNPRWDANEDNWTIHVIIGDTHIPMLDRMAQTHAGGQLPDDHPRMNAIRRRLSPNLQSGQPRVRRYGRLDLGPIEQIVTHLVGPTDANGLTTLVHKIEAAQAAWNGLSAAQKRSVEGAGIVASILELPEEIAALPGVLGALLALFGLGAADWERVNDRDGVLSDTMTVAQSEQWYRYYKEGVGGADVPQADIFEQAGQHLLDFVNALQSYRTSNASLLPVQFHQLGDMFDYWVGFTCHYVPSGSNLAPVNPQRAADDPGSSSYGSEMVSYWTSNCLTNTTQGQFVAQALDVANALRPEPVYLWGNHDNYLGGGLTPSYQVAGAARTLVRRQPNFHGEGLFMEHGHQWEDSNRDNAPIQWWWRYVIGTGSPQGEFLTQAAFIRPAPIRTFEGAAAGLAARFSPKPPDHPFGQRLTQLAYSTDKWVNGEGAFYCYVMGHTHAACLCRVSVRTDATQGAIETYRRDHQNDTASQVHLDLGNDDSGQPRQILWIAGDVSLATATIKWQGMLGLDRHDWVVLDDPDQTSAEVRKGMWKWCGDGRAAGSVTIRHPMPGFYCAKAYLDSPDGAFWRRSPERIGIQGLSIEGPPAHGMDDGDYADPGTRSFTFHTDESSFDREVVLRWAWDAYGLLNPNFPDEDILWFILLKASDLHGVPDGGKKAVLFRHRTANTRPWKQFKYVMGSHFNYGRWPLDHDWFLRFIVQQTPSGSSRWEIRAFHDTRGNSLSNPVEPVQYGMASFTVTKH